MLICHCKRVTDRDIKKAIHKGAWTLDDVIKRTGCCMGCGTCEDAVQGILDKEMSFIDNQMKNHPPIKIE